MSHYRTSDVRKVPGYGTVVALSRALGARQLRVSALGYYSPPLSAVVLVLGMLVFFTGAYKVPSGFSVVALMHNGRHSPHVRCAPLHLAHSSHG